MFLYSFLGNPALQFLNELRSIDAGFTKESLFWQQIEPERGEYDWEAVDAFAVQLESREDGLIALFPARCGRRSSLPRCCPVLKPRTYRITTAL